MFSILQTVKPLNFYNSKLKEDFANSRSDNSGRLPVSATFILNEGKEITWRHFDPDYKNRASVEDILKKSELIFSESFVMAKEPHHNTKLAKLKKIYNHFES